MTSERIKEIQEETAYPESLSVKHALLQVWNECQQEYNKQSSITVSNRRELLIGYHNLIEKIVGLEGEIDEDNIDDYLSNL